MGDKPTVQRLASSAKEIAQLLGWSMVTVHVMRSRWAKEGEAIFDLRGRGGRRHQHLTPEEERELLAPFVLSACSPRRQFANSNAPRRRSTSEWAPLPPALPGRAPVAH